MSGKIPDSTNVAFEDPLFAIFGPARGQIYGKTAEKMRVLARRADYPSWYDGRTVLPFSTRIKDAGIAIRHSQGYIISILQGPEMSLREWALCVQGSCTQEKDTFFL